MINVNRMLQTAAALAVLGAGFVPQAHADTILVSQSTMISGSFSGVYSFATTQSGTINLRLENIAWPERLAVLSCNLYDRDNLLGSLATTGELHIDVTGPGTYFSHLYAQAAGLLDLGIFSLNVTFRANSAPAVPLPPAVWLLLSAFALFGLQRFALPLLKFTPGHPTAT